MADVTFTEDSPPNLQDDQAPSIEQPKKSKAKSIPKGKQPAIEASLKSPQASKIRAPQSPLPAPPKSPKLSKSPKAAKPQNPTMMNMVLEALKDNKISKGITVQGIKRYITEKYPHTKETFSSTRLRQALMKGTDSNEIIRPKSSEDTGMKGYFLLNRALYSQKDKTKPKVPKAKKSAVEVSEDKIKQPAKVAKKTKAVLNTSGSAKTGSSKPKVAKTKPGTHKSESKTTKSKPAKSKSEPKIAKAKPATPKSEPKTAKTKPVVTKGESKTVIKKTAVKKSLKATSTPKAIIATPKLSKSTIAGSRQKTAAVKKLMKNAE